MQNSIKYFNLMLFFLLVLFQQNMNSQTTSVQGVLRDLVGRSVDDGNYELTFKLYTVSTGGTAFWTETQSSVAVSSGVFSAKLGTVTPITNISATQTYYLGVTTPGGGEMIPRIELTKSFSAMSSLSVTNAGDANIVGNDDNSGSGDIVMKTGNTERIRIANNNGEVLVGSPTKGIKMFNWGGFADLMSVGTKLSLNHSGNNDVLANVGGGNFGIGTSTPSSKLEVNGDIRLTSGGTGKLYFPDGTSFSSAAMGGSASSLSNLADAPITADGNNDGSGSIVMNTGASERLRIANNGNVGIGTTAPQEKLDVAGNATIQGSDFKFGTNDGRPIGTKTGQRAFVHTTAGDRLVINWDGDFEGGTSIGGVGSDNLFVSAATNGNIGIGTLTPSQRLELYNGKMLINGDGGGDAGSGATLGITSSNTNKPYLTVVNATNSSLSIGADQNAAIFGWDANAQNLEFRRNVTYGSFPNTGNVAMTILGSNGNVGIGVTNPSNKLSVANDIGTDAFFVGNDAKILDINVANIFGIYGQADAYWGGFKLGQTGPTVKGSTNWLEMSNVTTAKIWGTDAGRTAFQIGNTTGLARIWEISVGGSNNPAAQGGNGGFYIYDVSAGTNRMYIDASGGIVRNDGYNLWNTPSDRRVKKDITPYSSGLELIKQLNPVKFKYNGKGGTTDNGKELVSFIAQEIEQIPELAPLMVSKSNMKLEETDASETEVLSLNTSALQFVLVNAIKEQQKQIEELKAEIQELKKK